MGVPPTFNVSCSELHRHKKPCTYMCVSPPPPPPPPPPPHTHTHTHTTLIHRGADIESTSSFGFTPLLVAIRYTNPRCVEALLARNANVLTRDKKRNLNALLWAVELQNLEVLRVSLASIKLSTTFVQQQHSLEICWNYCHIYTYANTIAKISAYIQKFQNQTPSCLMAYVFVPTAYH